MYRGYRRFVSLALCVCFTLSMLFLNTLDVKAADSLLADFSPTFALHYHPSAEMDKPSGSITGTIRDISGGGGTISTSPSFGTSGTISNNSGGGGSISGSITTYSKGLYTYHVSCPFDVLLPWDNLTNSDYYNVNLRWNSSANITCTKGTLSNFAIYNRKHELLFSNVTPWYGANFVVSKSDVLTSNVDTPVFACPFIIEFDWTHEESVHVGVTEYNSQVDFYTTFDGFRIYVTPTNSIASTPVTDTQANQSLDSIESSSESTASNTGGILSKVTEFFGSFFSNLIGIFVPEEGYFSSWFNRLNTLLADKLGMLYSPFDLLIQVLTSILNADDSFAGIPFPGIEWDGHYLVEPFTFTFSSLGDVYTDLQGYVYFGTDVILLLAFFGLLQDKIKHILED